MAAQEYTAADLAAVADNPELTAEDIAAAVPFDQAFPNLTASIRRRVMETPARRTDSETNGAAGED